MVKYANKKEQKKIALERIEVLFLEAKKVFKKDSKLADKYVKMAREMAMKYKVKIRQELKRKFCKHCYHYLMPSVNLRVRTREGKVIYYCLDCKKYMRFVIKT